MKKSSNNNKKTNPEKAHSHVQSKPFLELHLSLLTSSWRHTLCSPRAHLGGSPFIALQIFLSQGRSRGHDATVCMLWSLQSLFFSESRVLFAAEDLHPLGGQLDYKAQ